MTLMRIAGKPHNVRACYQMRGWRFRGHAARPAADRSRRRLLLPALRHFRNALFFFSGITVRLQISFLYGFSRLLAFADDISRGTLRSRIDFRGLPASA